jgi:hypothetical protein
MPVSLVNFSLKPDMVFHSFPIIMASTNNGITKNKPPLRVSFKNRLITSIEKKIGYLKK